jgi:xylan 1,4-beta-xylosidase
MQTHCLLGKVKQQVESSAMPHLPVLITEWSSQNPAFIADTIRNCIGLTECMSYWTFSNVFEELGVPGTVFNNTFGLLDQYGIPRTSFHAMSLLRKLGEKRLQTGDSPVLATQRPDGSIAMLAWNLIPEAAPGAFANGNPEASAAGASLAKGAPLVLNLQLNGLDGRKQIRVSEVNDAVGSAIPAWEAMGKPASPTREQIADLHRAAKLPAATVSALKGSASETFSITLPPNGIALLELDA